MKVQFLEWCPCCYPLTCPWVSCRPAALSNHPKFLQDSLLSFLHEKLPGIPAQLVSLWILLVEPSCCLVIVMKDSLQIGKMLQVFLGPDPNVQTPRDTFQEKATCFPRSSSVQRTSFDVIIVGRLEKLHPQGVFFCGV